MYGGTINVRGHTPRWCVESKKALAALKDLRPYLYLKQNQADLAIEFESKKKRGLVPDYIYEADCYSTLRSLKEVAGDDGF